jgi:hypothetical protein
VLERARYAMKKNGSTFWEALWMWVYALAWFMVNDVVKMLAYRLLRARGEIQGSIARNYMQGLRQSHPFGCHAQTMYSDGNAFVTGSVRSFGGVHVEI